MLTIVMVALNNPSDVAATLHSLPDMMPKETEIILVDSSNDDSVFRTFNSFEGMGKLQYWWQPASGIYSAMNFGSAMARKDSFLWFLNPGDKLVDFKVTERLIEILEETSSSWGFAQAQSEHLLSARVFPASNCELSLDALIKGNLSICHQAMIIRCADFIKLKGFNLKYQIAADFDFQIKAMKEYLPIFVPNLMIDFDTTGISHQRVFKTMFETDLIRFRSKYVSFRWIINNTCRMFSIRILFRLKSGLTRNRK
jgi:glycosyltransferase involved in cell wall biosynthesis